MSIIQWLLSVIPWILLVIITATIVITLLCKYPAWDSKKKDSNGHPNKPRHEKWFYAWIIGIAVLGGTWAFFLPIAINSGFGKDDDGAALRQALIYTTGGILGVITLGETHRKNNLEKDKNDQDHTRQVHAERRSRYTKAIEHLFNENISIRLGGVYTLAGLADEWLSDKKTLPIEKERRKETQNIINNLCAYIRSPFPLAERAEQLDKDYAKDLQNDFDGDIEKFDADKRAFARDKATLEEERQVRQSIIKEICERLQDFGAPGLWSEFDYDFSNAHFFYPIVFTNSYFDASSRFFGATFTQDADFSGTTFTERAPFSEATFTCTPFSGTTFTERAPFSGAIFTEGADFSRVTFTQDADFSGAKFTQGAPFSGATFLQDAHFSRAAFTKDAKFTGATFTQDTDFSGATFVWIADFSEAVFLQDADFSEAVFLQGAGFSEAAFTQNAGFSWARFTGYTNFSQAEFTGYTNFSQAGFTRITHFYGATFTDNASFFRAEFTSADFSGAKFTGDTDFLEAKFTKKANFFGATFEEKPKFEYGLGNKTYKARFSCKADPEDYNFKVSPGSPYKIETEEKEYDGVKFIIPKGTELFDPDEPSEQGNNGGN